MHSDRLLNWGVMGLVAFLTLLVFWLAIRSSLA